jgi:hypothetical protein
MQTLNNRFVMQPWHNPPLFVAAHSQEKEKKQESKSTKKKHLKRVQRRRRGCLDST